MSTDKFYTGLISALIGAFGQQWYITGDTLAYFMCNYTLVGCKHIYIAATRDPGAMDSLAERRGYTKIGRGVYEASSGATIEIRGVKEIADVYKEYPVDYERAQLNFPTNIGTVLDNNNIRWTEDTKRNPKPEKKDVFFDKRRRDNGHEFIGKMLECGEKAGIRSKMFLAFGNLLGYALCKDFMPNDTDIDMNILASDVPQEQRHQYLMECKSAGLTENRMRGPLSINGRYVWFSIGPKSITLDHGVKSCNWFWFKHGGYWWHSKGKRWIGRKGLSDSYATAKGIPADIFNGEMRYTDFGGNKILVPQYIGKCLDWWYGDFLHRRNESSHINTVLVMPDEADQSTWYITNK